MISVEAWAKIHAVLTGVWVLLGIPTLLLWKESVLWVALMSLWANIASHAAAWQATKAERASQNGPSSPPEEPQQ